MTNKTCTLTIAGHDFAGIKTSDGEYYISVLEYQEYLGLSKDFTRDSNRGKSPELLLEAGLDAGLKTKNLRIAKSTKAFLDTKDFVKLLGAFAGRGNKKALALLLTLANETLERRIDAAVGVVVKEQTREERALASFRQFAREEFTPAFTDWIKKDHDVIGETPNYAMLVNQLKQAAGIPLINVDEYDMVQMKAYVKAIRVYDGFRDTGYAHNIAMDGVIRHFRPRNNKK